MSKTTFEFDRFLALQSVDLHDYMEPLIANADLRVPTNSLNDLLDSLGDFDHYHLVYAMILCSRFAPERFVGTLPRYLSHNEMSVRAAATNLLRELRREFITPELASTVAAVASQQRNEYLQSIASELEQGSGAD
jgi:hypothetical protein